MDLFDPASEDPRALIAIARCAKDRGFSLIAKQAFSVAMTSITRG